MASHAKGRSWKNSRAGSEAFRSALRTATATTERDLVFNAYEGSELYHRKSFSEIWARVAEHPLTAFKRAARDRTTPSRAAPSRKDLSAKLLGVFARRIKCATVKSGWKLLRSKTAMLSLDTRTNAAIASNAGPGRRP